MLAPLAPISRTDGLPFTLDGPRGRGIRLRAGDRIRVLALEILGFGVRPLARSLGLSPKTIISLSRTAAPRERRQANRLASRARRAIVHSQRGAAKAAALQAIQMELRSTQPDVRTLSALVHDLAARRRRAGRAS